MRAAMKANRDPGLLDSREWESTTLGPSSGWPEELRFAVTTVMPSGVPMMIWWGPDLVQIYNEAYVPLLGNKHPAAMGQQAAECWSEAWDSFLPAVHGVRATGRASFDDALPLWIDRYGFIEETHWSVSLSPIRQHGTGDILGLLCATTEKTEEVVTRRRLRSLRLLGEVTTSQGTVEASDAAMEALTGMDLDLRSAALYCAEKPDSPPVPIAWIGEFDADGPDEALAAITAMVSACEATGQPQELDDHDPQGGKETPQPRQLRESTDDAPGPSMLCLPVNSDDGVLTAALVVTLSPHLPFNDQFRTYVDLVASQFHRIVVDTSIYDMEKSRRKKLADMDEAKSRLFQNISHEFRTPLTMIHGPQQSLLHRADLNLTADERADLASAVRATERLQRLVDGLLEVARGQADKIVTDLEATNVPCLTEDGVAMFRAAAEDAGLDLTLTVSPDFPTALLIDRELWMRVLLNVVSNAVKYTAVGSVGVDLAYLHGDVVLCVTDTGVGIAAEDLPCIFDRFHQAPTRPVRGDVGSGIGLALVSELLRAVGGSATIDSTVGQGTKATLCLPAEPTTDPTPPPSPGVDRLLASEQAALEALTPAAEAVGTGPADESAGRGRVLVVEDNDDLRTYVSRLLRAAGWWVTATDSAEAAQEQITGQDVVVSDIMLPGMSGLDLVRWMRSQDDVRWTPVLLLTARAGTDSVVEGLTAGADDFVTKPFDPDELIARVGTHIELSLLRKVVLDNAEDRAENLQRALSSNRLIGTALGIIMVTRKVPADQAFALLRQASQTSNRKLRDVSDEVVFTGALPD